MFLVDNHINIINHVPTKQTYFVLKRFHYVVLRRGKELNVTDDVSISINVLCFYYSAIVFTHYFHWIMYKSFNTYKLKATFPNN